MMSKIAGFQPVSPQLGQRFIRDNNEGFSPKTLCPQVVTTEYFRLNTDSEAVLILCKSL